VNLINKLLKAGVKEAKSIQEGLLEKFQIKVPLNDVEEVLEHMDYLNSR
jgi:hypothetical protein